MKILVWKTGRLYDKYGHVMAATKVDSRIVYFDASRGLEGVIDIGNTGIETDTDYGFKALVMTAYDNGLYSDVWTYGEKYSETIAELYEAVADAKKDGTIEIEKGYKA
jgi:hypothetical protein